MTEAPPPLPAFAAMVREDIELACERARAGEIVLVRERVAVTDLELVELGGDVELVPLQDAPRSALAFIVTAGLEVPAAPARLVVCIDGAGVAQSVFILGPGARRFLA